MEFSKLMKIDDFYYWLCSKKKNEFSERQNSIRSEAVRVGKSMTFWDF